MPQVRRTQREVSTSPLPGVRKTAGETAASRGVGVIQAEGEAQVRSARALGDVGAVVGNTGIRLYQRSEAVNRQLADDARRHANQVAVLNASNRLDDWEIPTIHDPQHGVLAITGKAAFDLPEQVDKSFAEVTAKIEQDLSTDEQRFAFAQMKAERHRNVAATVLRHVNGEMRQYDVDEHNAKVSNKASLAAANALDPRRVGVELQGGVDEIRAFGARQGMGPDAVQAQVDAFQSGVHIGVIRNLLANDKDAAAGIYFEEAKGQISGDKLDEVEAAIKSASTAATGLRTAETLWQQLGPKSDTDPINLDAMETAARAQFADNPKALDATIRYLRERKAGVDASRHDREEASTGSLWIAASRGATLADLERMPAFINAPGKLQASLSDYIVGQAEHRANRAAALETRTYTREQRASAAKTDKGWSRYWELSSPATLAATTENALEAMRGTLGDDHVNRLLGQKRGLDKGADAVRAATIDDDLFKTTARSAGLNAYSPKTDTEKSDLGQLKNAVETAIDAEQQATGKTLDRSRKQEIMRAITDQHVMLNVWGRDEDRIAALVTNADDRAKAYVPLTKVPAIALTQYLNYARSLSPMMQRMSDAELRARFTDRIQRAYALRTLGASRGEIEAVMKGED